MDIDTLMKIYHAFFYSIISYGIIAWGGAYKTTMCLLQNSQTTLLKIINKNHFSMKNPLNIEQTFTLESVTFHYNKLKNMYLLSESKTRNKNIILPKMKKAISDKNSYIEAIKTYNILPKEFKCLNTSRRIIKKNIKKFIKSM